MKLCMAIFISLMMFPQLANANTVNVTSKIIRTLSGSTHGGCMVQIEKTISGCGSNWVNLDCGGQFFSNGHLRHKVATAAGLASKNVLLTVHKDKIIAGFCTANRIDMTL